MRGSSSCGDVSADEGDNSAGYSKLRKRMQRKRDAKTKQNGANNEHASDEILIGAELKERRKVSSASRVSHRSMSRSRSRGRQTRSVVSADGNRFGVKQGHLSEQLSENQRTTIMYPAKQLHREHTSNISVVSDTTRAFDYCCDLPPLAGTGSRDSKHSIRLLADDSVASFPSFALDQNLKMADAGRESIVEVFHSSRLPNSSPPQSVRSASTVLHNHLEPAAPPSTPLPVHQQENLTRALYTWRTLLRHVFTPLYLVQVLTGARILGKFESAGKKKSFTLKRWVGIVLTLASFADVARWGHFVAKTARQMVMVMRQISLARERFSRLNNQCRLGRSASSLGMQSARSSEFGEVINTEKERLLKDTELGLDCQYGFRNFFADLIVHGIGAFKDLRIVLQNKWISRTGQQLPSTHECKQQDQQVEVVMLQHELDGLKADLQVGLLALFASVLSLPRAISGISMNDSVGSVAKSIFPSWFLGFSAATAAATCTVIPPDVVDLFA
ncbi:hypothetical protein HDU84_006103 [Entophlyctis sp. JEL0112]|nr:hypothetical protein HDU84_006103 [Entophlyctis sp. JEL0112]